MPPPFDDEDYDPKIHGVPSGHGPAILLIVIMIVTFCVGYFK